MTPCNCRKTHTSLHECLNAVVTVFATSWEPNFRMPWDKEEPYYHSSSGFVVADPRCPETGRLIVTNAHCINDAIDIKVKRYQSEEKVTATVLKQVIDCDIAVLEVAEQGFWSIPEADGASSVVKPLTLGKLPKLQDSVHAVGYPAGGREVSITSGNVSRIETQIYAHSGMELLCFETTALTGSGSSGGPVLNLNNEVVGISFQADDRIGQFIPVCVFQRFLIIPEDQVEGEIQTVAGSGFTWQRLEANYMRKKVMKGLTDESGIYICSVASFGEISETLSVGDVLIEIDGMSISNFGTVLFEGNRVNFMHVITCKAVGDKITARVVRAGKRVTVSWTLRSADTTALVPKYDKMKCLGRDPDYVVFGGLVLVSLCERVFHSLNGEVHTNKLYSLGQKWRNTERNAEYEEVVVISKYLPNDAISGFEYQELEGHIISTIDGVSISSLRHAAEVLRSGEEEMVNIGLLRFNFSGTSTVILSRQEVAEAENNIKETYRIRALARINGLEWEAGSDSSNSTAVGSTTGR